MKQRFPGIRVNFAAHAIHVNLDQIRERIERFIPHVLGNFRTSDDAAGVARQIFEQRISLGGEWHTAASPGNALRCGIKDKVGDGYFGGAQLTRTPQQRAEARKPLATNRAMRPSSSTNSSRMRASYGRCKEK